MNIKKTTLLALFAATLMTASADAANFFLSSSNTDPTVGADLSINEGESGMLYVWAELDAGERLSAVSLDVLTSADGVLKANDFITENPTVDLGFSGMPNRWQGNLGKGTYDTPGKLVDNAVSLYVTEGAGLFQAAAAVDGGTVVGNNFLHAAVAFDAVSAGASELTLGVGSSLIQKVGVGEYVPNFGPGASITVTGTAIPEPTTLSLAGLAIAGIAGIRRRS